MFGAGLKHFSNVHTPDEPEAITIGVTITRESDTEEFECNGTRRFDSITALRVDDDVGDGSDRTNFDTAAVALVEPVHAAGGKHTLALNGSTDTEAKAGMKEQIAGYKSISVIEMHEDRALCSNTS